MDVIRLSWQQLQRIWETYKSKHIDASIYVYFSPAGLFAHGRKYQKFVAHLTESEPRLRISQRQFKGQKH